MPRVKSLRTAKDILGRSNFDAFVATQKQANSAQTTSWNAPSWYWRSQSIRTNKNGTNVWFDLEPASRGTKPFPGDFFDLVRAMCAKAIADRAGKLNRTQLELIVKACSALCFHAPNADVTLLLQAHFVEAEKRIKSIYPKFNTHLGIIGKLQWIANMLDKYRMCNATLQWKRSKSIGSTAEPPSRRVKSGEKFEEESAAKLPMDGIHEALGALSCHPDLLVQDRLLVRATDLLVTCGFRATEVLSLPRNTLVLCPILDEGGQPVISLNGEPDMDVFLRYWPAKGGHAVTQMKPVPRPYRDIVLRAIAEILQITEPYAKTAHFMRASSGRTLLPPPYDDLPDDALLTLHDIGILAGSRSGSCDKAYQYRHRVGNDFIVRAGIPVHRVVRPDPLGRMKSYIMVRKSDVVKILATQDGDSGPDIPEPYSSMPEDSMLTVDDVARVIGKAKPEQADAENNDDADLTKHGRQYVASKGISTHETTRIIRLKGGFTQTVPCTLVRKADFMAFAIGRSDHDKNLLPPSVGVLHLNEALFVVPEQFFSTIKESVAGTVRILQYPVLRTWLAGRTDGKQKSVFERLNIVDVEGRPFRANSHQFRHWLDTLFSEGGLTEMERARFAGRARIDQNSAYDHVPGTVLAKQVLAKMNGGQAISPAVEHAKKMPTPIRREEFQQGIIGTIAHLTELGLCTHDFAATPCPNHGSHAECKDHWICKGNPGHRAEAERLLEEHKWVLELAGTERDGETYGADNWYKHTAKVCLRLEKIISIHRSNMIPDGWLVQLSADGEVIDTMDLEATLAAG